MTEPSGPSGPSESFDTFDSFERDLRAFADHPPAEPTPIDALRALATAGARRRWWRRLAAGTAVVVSGGLLGGLVGGAGGVDLVAERAVRLGPDAVPIFACPGTQPRGSLHRGDRVYATAADESRAWVRVRAPYDLGDGAWVAARWVVPDRTLADVPVVEEDGCASPPTTATTAPVTTTSSTSTTTSSSTSSATTTTTRPGAVTVPPPTVPPVTAPPTETTQTTAPATTAPPTETTGTTATTATTVAPATTTTTAPDTSGPSMTGLSVSPPGIGENTSGSGCPPYPKTTTVSVTVTDPSGIDKVRVSWSYEAVGGSKNLTASGALYSTTLSFVVNSTQAIALNVKAYDDIGNTTEQATSVTVFNC